MNKSHMNEFHKIKSRKFKSRFLSPLPTPRLPQPAPYASPSSARSLRLAFLSLLPTLAFLSLLPTLAFLSLLACSLRFEFLSPLACSTLLLLAFLSFSSASLSLFRRRKNSIRFFYFLYKM